MNKPISAILLLVVFAGCNPEKAEETIVKKPRPVEVSLLKMSRPLGRATVSAPVASWKTEQIGMEVGGRIEWVVEPNTDIEGRVTDADGKLIVKGDPIARINNERFQLQVESQKAQVERARQAINSAKIQIEKTLPAQIRAAKAEEKRAQTEYERSKRLVAKNAGAQSDVDRDEAALSSATSQIEQLNANVRAKQAELASLDAQLVQAQEALKDAEKNVDDCTLFSSFRGQIAEVAVVPGSVVAAGQAVATIQMMDPIKVEVEVSAEDSRRLRNRQRIPLMVTREDGRLEEHDGFLYLVDSVADPQTRTFTLTLLVMNQRITDSQGDRKVPTTDHTWRLDFQFLPGAKDGALYAPEEAIVYDDEGPFVWRIDNMELHGTIPEDRVLKVSKSRIELGAAKLPFLGNWVFQQVNVLDERFDASRNLIAGKFSFPEGIDENWDGDEIVFQNEGQWMLRPGDLVKADLSDSTQKQGLFVPMDAIAYEDQRTFLFLLNESEASVTKVEVQAQLDGDDTSAMVAVTALNSAEQIEGRKYVVRGAHYLIDGEKVRPIESEVR